jgi:hypothetical protein
LPLPSSVHVTYREQLAIAVASLLLLALSSPALAGSLCYVDKAVSEKLHRATAQASAELLEATSHLFLAFRTADEPSGDPEPRLASTRALLDKAILNYKRALSFTDDLEQADIFLKKRPFESLRIKFGITPGTLNQTRWEIIAKTVTESQTPAADLIGVCATGAETLKASTSTVKAGMPATQIRRRIYTWWLVLTHGMLVSDAFDSSVR